jgi:hypothetical protein
MDGPLTAAVRCGAICYLTKSHRQDTTVVFIRSRTTAAGLWSIKTVNTAAHPFYDGDLL